MLCVCVGDVMDVVFSVCIVRRGAVGARVCKRLFCFVQAKTLCRYGCMYFLAALVLVCVDVMSSA